MNKHLLMCICYTELMYEQVICNNIQCYSLIALAMTFSKYDKQGVTYPVLFQP